MWLVRRGGRAFLVLPENRDLAAKGLELYSAQTKGARLAKAALRFALQFGMHPGLERVKLKPSRATGFAAYLGRAVGSTNDRFPDIALLAGNPRARGRRWVLLVVVGQGEPTIMVNDGYGVADESLIMQHA